MSQNEPSGTEGGNKQTPSFQCKNWIGTWNNYPENAFELLGQTLVPLCQHYVFGKEVGEQGTPHIQMAFCLKKKLRQSTIYKMLKHTFYLDKMKGRWKDQKYCKKDGDFITSDEIIHTEPIPEHFNYLIDLIDNYPYGRGDRNINVVVDYKGRLGKTEFIRSLAVKYDDLIITGGKSADMKHQIIEFKNATGRCPKIVFIDIPRKNKDYVSWGGIEEIKNMMFYSGKYEGGMVIGNKPFVCVMTNDMPDLSSLSQDRWQIKEFGEKPEEKNTDYLGY